MDDDRNETIENTEDTNNSDDKKKPGILKGFLEFFYGNFVVLLLGFVSLPLITRVLSTDEYGRTSLYSSVVSIIYIFAILGLDQGYIRYYHKENVDRKKLFGQCVKWPFVLILIISTVYCIFSGTFNSLLFGKGGIDVTALVVVYTITSVFERFLFLDIRMDQKGKLYSNLNILSKVLYIVVIVLFVYILGDDFRVGMYALTIPLVIVTLIVGIRFAVVNKNHIIQKHELDTRELLMYSIPFIPMLLMEWLLSSMDKWSVKIFRDYAETGVYSAAMQIMTILLTFKITFIAFWSPIAMEKYEKEPEEVVKPFFADMFQKVQFLGMLAAFGLTMARGLIVLILGENYREAIRIIPFLSLMPVMSILFEMTGQGLKFKGKTVCFNYASLAAIIVNLVGNTILVPIYGGIGAAAATAATYIVYFAIGTALANKYYPINYGYGYLAVSLAGYAAYAYYATICSNELMNVAVGFVAIVLLCVLNRKVVGSLWKYGYGLIKDWRFGK